ANPEECNEWFLSRLEELEGCDPGRAQAVEDAVWNYLWEVSEGGQRVLPRSFIEAFLECRLGPDADDWVIERIHRNLAFYRLVRKGYFLKEAEGLVFLPYGLHGFEELSCFADRV